MDDIEPQHSTILDAARPSTVNELLDPDIVCVLVRRSQLYMLGEIAIVSSVSLATNAPSSYAEPAETLAPASPDIVVEAGSRRRRPVKTACINCRGSGKRCDVARPCERCIKLGSEATCIDAERKKRKERSVPSEHIAEPLQHRMSASEAPQAAVSTAPANAYVDPPTIGAHLTMGEWRTNTPHMMSWSSMSLCYPQTLPIMGPNAAEDTSRIAFEPIPVYHTDSMGLSDSENNQVQAYQENTIPHMFQFGPH